MPPKRREHQVPLVPRHETLGAAIGSYLKELGMEQGTLANEIGGGTTAAVVSNWVTGQRRPARDTIWTIAQVLGKAVQRRAGARRIVRADAISILLRLLHAGGYEADWEGRYDVVWENYLADRSRDYTPKFRIGYAQAPPYIDKDKLEGSICWRIASRLVRELHAEPVHILRSWSSLIDGLEDGEIDIIAPLLMRVPTRAPRVLFSDGIGLLSGYRALVRSQDKERATKDGVLNPRAIEVMQIAGEVGQLFCLLAPEAKAMQRVDEKPDPDLQEAARSLLDITSSDRAPCMITEIITCFNIETEFRGQLASIPLPPDIPMWYPLAFACHPRERRLNDAINLTLDNLRNAGTLHDWFIQWSDELSHISGQEIIRIDPTFPEYPKSLSRWAKWTKEHINDTSR